MWYYSQYVTDSIVDDVWRKFGERLLTCDKNFNDIPLAVWDDMARCYVSHVMDVNQEINGRPSWSLSDGVCMLKTAARRACDEY